MSDITSEPVNSKPGEAYFLSLTVENFRCFGPKQTLDLSDGNGNPAMWNVLLGENGNGKTSTLSALLSTFPYNRGIEVPNDRHFFGSKIIRDGIKNIDYSTSSIPIDFPGVEKFLSAFSFYKSYFVSKLLINNSIEFYGILCIDDRSVMTKSIEIPAFIIAYGSNRLSNPSFAESHFSDSVQLLTNPFSPLPDPEESIMKADYANRIAPENPATAQNYKLIKNLLIEILPDIEDFRISNDKLNKPKVEAITKFGPVKIKSLSLGYQSTLSWIIHFAEQLMAFYPNSTNPFSETAVCLVDEIDLHLHPRWQKQLVQTLRRVFPKTQFIVTAHSPLIVQADPNTNIALFRREGDHVVIENEVDYIRNWRVDQILSSELFSEVGPYPPHIQAKLDERRALLGKPTLTDDDQARIDAIDAELEALPAETRPDDMRTMDLLREAAALIEADSKR